MKNIKLLFTLLILSTFSLSTYSQTTIYTNDMDYVIGDAKQAFIQNKITTQEQADNLLKGFINQKVNGIRIPIYAQGMNPNKPMFDYFYNIVVASGLPIFANPAQSSGGQRVGCEMLNGTVCGINSTKISTLISRIIAFSNEYNKCKWINPFNEDGRTNNPYSATQINTIYSSLYNNLNDAELIGSCAWGLPASIDVMQKTNIADYITVAASHNLGFNHGQWSTFINLAKAEGLPVWDSEVNHFDKFGTGTRLEKALEYGVDGLVMYDSWRTINLADGSVNAGGQEIMKLYLKDYEIPVDPVSIALNGIATQSSTNPTFNKPASLAIDGNTNGNYGAGSVTVTNSEENPWWQVDLGLEQAIGEIKVFNRTDGCCKARMSNFTVSVINGNGTTTYSKTYTTYPDPSVTADANGVKGQIVKVQLNLTSALTLAEVQVFAPNNSLSTENYTTTKVNIYPNPFANQLSISSNNNIVEKYTIYNVNGQEIKSGKINSKETKINVREFSTGIYFLKLKGLKFTSTYKIVKQ